MKLSNNIAKFMIKYGCFPFDFQLFQTVFVDFTQPHHLPLPQHMSQICTRYDPFACTANDCPATKMYAYLLVN